MEFLPWLYTRECMASPQGALRRENEEESYDNGLIQMHLNK